MDFSGLFDVQLQYVRLPDGALCMWKAPNHHNLLVLLKIIECLKLIVLNWFF